jgi:hypothetical protein
MANIDDLDPDSNLMLSTDDLDPGSIDKALLTAMLTARKRWDRENAECHSSEPDVVISQLDIVMYLARWEARRNYPPVVSAEYLSQLKLGTVYGTD